LEIIFSPAGNFAVVVIIRIQTLEEQVEPNAD